MDADLNTLATAHYARADDAVKAWPELASARGTGNASGPARTPECGRLPTRRGTLSRDRTARTGQHGVMAGPADPAPARDLGAVVPLRPGAPVLAGPVQVIAATPAAGAHLLLPDPSPAVVLCAGTPLTLHDSASGDSWTVSAVLRGPRTRPLVERPGTCTLLAPLVPDALLALAPGRSLVDDARTLAETWGAAGTDLVDRVRTAVTEQGPAVGAELLAAQIVALAADRPAPAVRRGPDDTGGAEGGRLLARALAAAQDDDGLVRPADLARAADLPTDALYRLMLARTGLTPVQHLAAVRFAAAVRAVLPAGSPPQAVLDQLLQWTALPPREVQRVTGMSAADLGRWVAAAASLVA